MGIEISITTRCIYNFGPLLDTVCCCLVIKLCLILCNPVDCSQLDASVYGISLAGILE